MKITASIAATVFCGCTFLSSIVFGQMGPGGPGGRIPGGPGGPRGFGIHAGKVVTGAPYSATVTNTTVKTLSDGNTIQHTTTGTVARDSQGRTYSQETITFGGSNSKVVTFISDPVAGYVYTLDASTKTAIRRAIHVPGSGGGNGGPNGFGKFAKPSNEGTTAKPAAVTADLGTQLMNGVNAQGKSITRTIPAGAMGNEKPIVSTTETWYSPDLQVVVFSKRSDPREGTSTYALTNIQKGDPSNVSFAVPSDYTISDAPKFGGRH